MRLTQPPLHDVTIERFNESLACQSFSDGGTRRKPFLLTSYLKLTRCQRSLAATLAASPSISLLPVAPFLLKPRRSHAGTLQESMCLPDFGSDCRTNLPILFVTQPLV